MEKETGKRRERDGERDGERDRGGRERERGIKGERPNHITRVRLGKRKSLSDEKAIYTKHQLLFKYLFSKNVNSVTDQRMERRTNRVTYRVACTRLKIQFILKTPVRGRKSKQASQRESKDNERVCIKR